MDDKIEINGNMDLGAYSPLELTEEDINESLKEKAVSKAQQRFMGMVHAVQKGELDADEVGSSVAKAAKTMKKKDVKDFAETKHKGLPNHVDENTLVRLIRESIQEHLVDVMKRYTEGKATSKEANKAIMDLANSSNMKLNENEFDELSISTMQNAYDKMLRYGQSNRASDLGAKSWKKIYHSNIDNLTIFTNVWGINVSDPSFTSENFIFNIEKCEWEGYQPRFADRKAAVILANLIRQECGERAGDFGNKAMYIK